MKPERPFRHRQYRQLPSAHIGDQQAVPVGADGKVGRRLDPAHLNLLRLLRRLGIRLGQHEDPVAGIVGVYLLIVGTSKL